MSAIGVVVRDTRADAAGGDLVQARAIARFLKAAGARVDYVGNGNVDGRRWDVAVMFNVASLPESLMVAEQCARRGLPYVVFPIFWDLTSAIPVSERAMLSRLLPAESTGRRAATRGRFVVRRWKEQGLVTALRAAGVPRKVAISRILERAMLVCPNSRAEARHLAGYLGCEVGPTWVVVRNGIWPEEVPAGDPWEQRREEVLCLGAVSPRKNSLALVEAAEVAGVRLRIVGQNLSRMDGYARRVAARCNTRITLEGYVRRGSALQLLGQSRAHAQVGFVETPGLATMEAAAAGAAAVAASTPVVTEYFPSGLWTVDPCSVAAIAEGLSKAVSTPPEASLAEHVRRVYDWRAVLQPLRELLGL